MEVMRIEMKLLGFPIKLYRILLDSIEIKSKNLGSNPNNAAANHRNNFLHEISSLVL